MKGILYFIMDMDQDHRPEHLLMAKTDKSARTAAKKDAERYGIKEYAITFYRASDGCRGSIDK